ncbi:MAG TPA: hypothetical protein VK387_07250 [Thermoleophilaceae bacterium]|nr:hypothetical protein [Thermoleophilaceae bacterium]
MRLRARSTLALVVLVAAGCAGGPGGARPGDGAGRPTPDAAIAITYDGGAGDLRRAEILCGDERDEVRGSLRHEQPSDACRRLAGIAPFLTASPPRGRVCAQVYGGPERARFSGRFAGRRVDRRFARTDACEIKDWERVSGFLPTPR